MNGAIDCEDTLVYYYDGDYPAEVNAVYPENFDATTEFQGLRYDVQRYLDIVRTAHGDVLELCCGTGRVAMPLAREGIRVTGVDISEKMLRRFRVNVERETEDSRGRIEFICQDVTQLSLPRTDYAVAIMAFNSLLCIPDFEAQCRALHSLAAHLAPAGRLVLDIVNPLALKLQGDPAPKPFFTRRNPTSGNMYTRFAMIGPLDDSQRQRLYGWYDEEDPAGHITRRHYAMHWRPIFRFEIELMLRQAGFEITTLEGGHRREPFTTSSPRMFIQAMRKANSPA